MQAFLTDHWGVVAFGILALVYIVFLFGPWNWRYIPNRWAGVKIHLGQVVPELIGEGPILITRPFDRLVKVPLFDLPVRIDLPDMLTAAPSPQNVRVFIVLVVKFGEPIQVVQSVPDRDPIDEFKGFVRAACRSSVQSMTIEEITQKSALDNLARMISQKLETEPVLTRWGLQIISVRVTDVNLPKPYQAAQDAIVSAKGEAEATRIRSNAQRAAADALGAANKQGVAALLITQQQQAQVATAKAGGIRTLVQVAGDAIENFMKDL